jgi:hypothetical protein
MNRRAVSTRKEKLRNEFNAATEFNKIRDYAISAVELSPIEWKKTRARDDVRQLLEANPFRRATVEAGR